MRVLHIIPNPVGSICGVADYAAIVGAAMERLRGAVECRYISVGVNCVGESRNGKSLLDIAVSKGVDSCVLHYSPYGYDRFGAPGWLAEWVGKKRDLGVTVFFHELFASGWPWQRSFWYSARQKSVVKQLVTNCLAVITNRCGNAKWLYENCDKLNELPQYLPVFSNVGEPLDVPLWADRRKAITFGGAVHKRAFYSKHWGGVVKACNRLGINEIVNVGARLEQKPVELGMSISDLGILEASEVSEVLLNCKVMFFDYFTDSIGKSGVLAAAASHGVPLLVVRDFVEAEGLKENVHLCKLNKCSEDWSEGRFTSLSVGIRRWYSDHSISRHADLILKACEGKMDLG